MVKVDGPAEGPSLWLTGFAFMASWLVRTWPWLPGRVTIPDDAKAHFLPQVQFLAHSLWQSERPFWTSFVFSDHRQIAAAAELILVLAKRLCPVVPYLAAALATHNDKMLSRDGFPDIDSGGTVLLETPPHYVLTVTATGSAIRAYRNDEVVIEASSDGGWLVLNDVWPGCLQCGRASSSHPARECPTSRGCAAAGPPHYTVQVPPDARGVGPTKARVSRQCTKGSQWLASLCI